MQAYLTGTAALSLAVLSVTTLALALARLTGASVTLAFALARLTTTSLGSLFARGVGEPQGSLNAALDGLAGFGQRGQEKEAHGRW